MWYFLLPICDAARYFCRFKEGLKTLGVLDAMKAQPSLFAPLMCSKPASLTSGVVENLFHPQLSIPGSSRRTVENRTYAWWLDMLQDMEGKFHSVLVRWHVFAYPMAITHMWKAHT